MTHFLLISWFLGFFTSKDAWVVAKAVPDAKIPKISTINADLNKYIVSPPSDFFDAVKLMRHNNRQYGNQSPFIPASWKYIRSNI
jgi:hypothetical protein